MANIYPLTDNNYRVPPPQQADGQSITVVADDGDEPAFNPETGTLVVDIPDGTVEISFGAPTKPKKSTHFDANLANDLTDSELSTIAERLLLGIEQDAQSRSNWLENMSNGISLLGLEIKNPRGAAASGATPAEGVSTVDHPLLLEAVLRFQANARGELLPTDGPVKVRNDGEGNSLAGKLADALEKDMNHFLTKTAKEYYPDTDRMLLMLGFSGISFKKGYHDPIKRRPVIASIDAKDLIVSNAATDIDGAGRVTHRIMMRPSVLKRMQLVGAYRKVHLPSPGTPALQNPVDTKINQIQGIAPATFMEPDDQDRELYECYCEIEVPGHEHEMDGEATGLPLPYKVVIDKESRNILEIRRNWEEDDAFCMPRNRIIAYIFIPGLGFYGIGLINILGNATKAVTAAWRLMIDAGMFANFPGFLYLKSLAKQLTNQFRIPPGGGMPIDTVGNDIRSSIMPLPYKDPSPVFIQLIDNIATTAQRVGGTAELQIGEGKQDAPVGTTLAMIEQATKLMSAVHKRLHQAQGQEFDMLKSLLAEDPDALWRHNKKSKVLELLVQEAGQQPIVDEEQKAEDRHRQLFLAALADCELVPRADPNTSSQTERYLKVVAMRQMAATNPSIDINKIDERAFQTMGIDDFESLFKPPPPPGSEKPSPEEMTAQATMIAAQARITEAQTKATEAQAKAQSSQQDLASRERIAALNVSREVIIHSSDQQFKAQQQVADHQHKHALAFQQGHIQSAQGLADQAHEARENFINRAHEAQQGHHDFIRSAAKEGVLKEHDAQQDQFGHQHDAMQDQIGRQHEAAQADADRQHEMGQSFADKQHEAGLATHEAAREHVGRQHEAGLDQAARQHEAEQAELQRKHEALQNSEKAKAAAKAAAAKPKPKGNGVA